MLWIVAPPRFDTFMHAVYRLAAFVDPNSFDNYLSGSAGAAWAPGYAGGALDGAKAGMTASRVLPAAPIGETAVFYSYGNSGLNGDGGGGPVQIPSVTVPSSQPVR